MKVYNTAQQVWIRDLFPGVLLAASAPGITIGRALGWDEVYRFAFERSSDIDIRIAMKAAGRVGMGRVLESAQSRGYPFLRVREDVRADRELHREVVSRASKQRIRGQPRRRLM